MEASCFRSSDRDLAAVWFAYLVRFRRSERRAAGPPDAVRASVRKASSKSGGNVITRAIHERYLNPF